MARKTVPPRCPSVLRAPPHPSPGAPVRSIDRRNLAIYLSAPARRSSAADDEVADAPSARPGYLEPIPSAVFARKG